MFPEIAIAGAGHVGCFVAGCLAAAGHRVSLLARPHVADAVRAHGLRTTDYAGFERWVPAAALRVSTEPSVLADAGAVLVTVKGPATAGMAELLATHAARDAAIASLQNGVTNRAELAARLPGRSLMSAVVPFNVTRPGAAHFHKATEGDLVVQAGVCAWLVAALTAPGLRARQERDIDAVLWGKLVLNLNNALNALSGVSLPEQLRDPAWRSLLASQIDEALGVLAASGIRHARATRAPTAWVPRLLRLPTPVFARVAASMLKMDDDARSSMAHDLAAGRSTEIELLQGAIVALAAQRGMAAPVSERVRRAVLAAEAAGPPPVPVAAASLGA